ncbi:MAG: acetyl-CoA C-acetyltransferase [Pirellulaceae bacterium]|nr:acetyl-CoA C-acetyltransferase [Pirellulaceae bacterium]
MIQPVIISACRTPMGTLLGDLSTVPATDLGGIVVQEAVRRSNLPSHQVDEVIMGNILSAGLGQAPARQAALRAGLTSDVAALTINKMCGSGLKAVMLAAQAVITADANVVVAGGLESMSRAPHLILNQRRGWKFGNQTILDSMLYDGLTCAFDGNHMGQQAEYIAKKFDISRNEQDQFAYQSQQRAATAIQSGTFEDEIVPVEVPTRTSTKIVSNDQGPRPETTLATLSQLKPAFEKNGTVTAGNASQISDGAAAVVVTSNRVADEQGITPLARIVAYATAGVEPKDVFIAPVKAIEKVLDKAGMTVADMDLIEINEAFAAQMIACARPLDLPSEKLNIHGGAIALGHPIGASGARVLVTLVHAMKQRGARRGLVSLCLGGGNGVAMIVETDDD